MNEMQPNAAPRVTPAIAAVKDNVAAEYRSLIAVLPAASARTHWQESHGALCIIAIPALIRLSEEVGNVLAYACTATVDAAQLVTVVRNAGAAILAYMDHLAAGLPDQPTRLLPVYRALLQTRGIQHVPETDFFSSGAAGVGGPASGDGPAYAAAIPDSLTRDLKRFNDAWAAWAAGQMQADALRAEIDAVVHASAMLGGGAAAELLAEICSAMRAQAAAGTPDPDAVVEISCALLMLDDLIEDAPRAGASFARRAANARARLQACQRDREALQRLPPMELLDAQARRDEVKVVMSHTLSQADAAISYAVSVLEAFFADDQTRGALGLLDKPLAQCAGMFAMLQDEAAAAAIGVCRAEIAQLASGAHDETAIKDRLARRLTALTEYVRTSPQGDADLDSLLARAGLVAPMPVQPARGPVEPAKIEAPAVASESEEALDSDMLEIFLEEAVEVLAGVETVLPASRKDPQNLEHLTSLRRAFHTLKGSGRMVGLTDLGEAAWEIEQVFNSLAQDGLPATPDLYRLVALAHESFVQWVDELRKTGHTVVDAKILADWARRLRAGEPLPTQLTPASDPAPATLTVSAATPPVRIGTTVVSPVLYGIFVDEARQHVAALERYGRRVADEPWITADAEFQRAAHTLCGISATVGFETLSELASSLERILLRAEKAPNSLDATARADVMRAIERLAQMVASVAERQTPEPEQALIDALDKTATTQRVDFDAVNTDVPSTASMAAVPVAERVRASGERRTTRLDDDIDPELLAVFLTEAQELLPHIGRDLREWREHPEDKLTPQSLQRLLHTLKGSGRMAGAMAVGELTHRMETRVENASRLAAVPESLFDELDASFDRLNVLIDELQRLECDPGSVSQNLNAVSDPLSQTLTPASPTGGLQPLAPITVTQPVHTAFSAQPTSSGPAVTGPLGAVTETKPAAAQAAIGAAQRAVLRVRAESAERLANQAGEVAIARARAESELKGARAVMRELTDNIMRLRGQLREIEVQAEMQMQSRFAQSDETNAQFDPLEFDRFTRLQELTRLMAESVNDLSTVQQNLMRNLDEGEAALGAQARTTREMQDDLVRIRMAPFSSLSDRLYRVARLASRDVGKRVQLDIRGGHAELDRGVLDRIVAPLEHLLRNSIAHGIEAEHVRKAAGKAELGEIVIEVRQQGNEVVLGISDDGGGLDIARIRSQAVAKGLMREHEVLTDAQIADFIFRSGFSTAESVSEIAGRGVGMDVVRNEIASLGGRIEMDFERGKGTRFTIYLSLTLAVLKAVVIRVGEELYAVPSLLVEQVQSLKPDALATAYGARALRWREARYPLHYLAHLLGRTHTPVSQQHYNSVLLLRSGPHRAAIHVDQLLGGQEIVVKNIGPQLARVSGVTGAAVLAGGETVLILNPVQLAQRAETAPAQSAEVASASAPAAAATAAPTTAKTSEPAGPRAAGSPARQATVLVVDDSLTVRKITSRTLTREGYDVLLAKDGIEALEKMQARAPDVIITDIEMPRMDGFDLTRNVRADPRLKDLPVIMITSRTADKHRTHAAELGVTVFLGKPYEERELLQNIAGVVRVAA